MDLTQVLQKPKITEKSMAETSRGRYTFVVHDKATKSEIKGAVERFFGVTVKGVKTIFVAGKKRRVGRLRQEMITSSWKKAVVQLAPGEKIDVFETRKEGK